MLEKLAKAWRARRVLLIGLPDAQNLYAEALLCALGARPARLPPDAKAHTLCRALTSGRIGAVMIPCMQDVAAGSSLTQRLDALGLILREMREAGVPLGILCSHEDVYAPRQDAWQAEEGAPLGGRTREGLYQAILQLYADGVGRALLGDAVTTIVCRHAPCLGSDEESVRQYSAWCRAILGGGAPVRLAAEELYAYFGKMDPDACIAVLSGLTYDPDRPDTLWVGEDDAFASLLPPVPDRALDDGIYLSVKGGCGVVTGTNGRSVLIAAYRLLRENGCAFLTPDKDGERIPEKPLCEISAQVCEAASSRHRGVCIEGAVSYDHVLNNIRFLPKIGMNAYFFQFFTPVTFFARWYALSSTTVSVDFGS